MEVPKEKYKQMLYYLDLNISVTIASKHIDTDKICFKGIIIVIICNLTYYLNKHL
jgi:uncharacterized membrane protein